VQARTFATGEARRVPHPAPLLRPAPVGEYVGGPEDGMARMDLSTVRQHWDEFGRQDPMWAILTNDDKANRAWDRDAFFETGRTEIAAALAEIEAAGVTIRRCSAVDFGCGIGRLTQALAEHFEQVHGVDIAPSMIAAAQRENRHGARVTYHLNSAPRLGMFPHGSVDFVYSRIVLQHIPTPAARGYIGEFMRVLRPGGVAFFQMPTAARPLSIRARNFVRSIAPNAYRRVRDFISPRPRMEMNTLPERVVREIARRANAQVVFARPDQSASPNYDSRFYLIAKA